MMKCSEKLEVLSTGSWFWRHGRCKIAEGHGVFYSFREQLRLGNVRYGWSPYKEAPGGHWVNSCNRESILVEIPGMCYIQQRELWTWSKPAQERINLCLIQVAELNWWATQVLQSTSSQTPDARHTAQGFDVVCWWILDLIHSNYPLLCLESPVWVWNFYFISLYFIVMVWFE